MSETEQMHATEQATWQWCYVEKWVNGSGVCDRVTFDSEPRAFGYLGDNAQRVRDLNQELDAEDQIVASIEKRRTYEPAEWMPVEDEVVTATEGVAVSETYDRVVDNMSEPLYMIALSESELDQMRHDLRSSLNPDPLYARLDAATIDSASTPRPVSEPSDAQVEVAARVLFGATVDSMLLARELASIALRAAGGVR